MKLYPNQREIQDFNLGEALTGGLEDGSPPAGSRAESRWRFRGDRAKPRKMLGLSHENVAFEKKSCRFQWMESSRTEFYI